MVSYLENATQLSTTISENEFQISDEVFTFGVVMIWIITCITVFGNLLVIFSFIRDKSIRSKPANIFVLVLSIADTTVGVVSLPFANFWVMFGTWIFGETVCKINLFLDFSACAISTWCILLLTLDRYWMVKKHLRYKAFMTHRKARILSAVVVLYFTLFYGINVFFWRLISTDEVDYTEECFLAAGEILIFNIVIIFVEFLLILVLLIYWNSNVFKVVVDWSTGKSLRRDIQAKLKETKTIRAIPTNTKSPVISPSKNEGIRVFQGTQRNEIQKAATMLGAVVLGLLVCYTPYYIVLILGTLGVVEINDFILTSVDYFLWFNSCLNPILYAATNEHFRRNFVEILSCRQKSKLNKHLRKASNSATSTLQAVHMPR
ncbi:histamine H3 receptor-like [Anneissia japonica]|uniref:histamine H3 receptor-like n=1 Tax=Anneissia japonica TaxID=1529436 RepID=UPI0014254E2B|nr:histamine H3 receptor-like [Anneissia japonica]